MILMKIRYKNLWEGKGWVLGGVVCVFPKGLVKGMGCDTHENKI